MRKPLIIIRFFGPKKRGEEKRTYQPIMATSAAHARIVRAADERQLSIIDYIDYLTGVK